MFSVTKPKIDYDPNLRDSLNVFRDKFSSLSNEEWKAICGLHPLPETRLIG
jgi:hypothetical protein